VKSGALPLMGSWWKSNCNRTSKVIINHEDDYTSYVRTVSYGSSFLRSDLWSKCGPRKRGQ